MRADVAGARSPSEPAAVGEPHHAGVLRGPARPARRPRTTTKHGVGRVRLGLISAAGAQHCLGQGARTHERVVGHLEKVQDEGSTSRRRAPLLHGAELHRPRRGPRHRPAPDASGCDQPAGSTDRPGARGPGPRRNASDDWLPVVPFRPQRRRSNRAPVTPARVRTCVCGHHAQMRQSSVLTIVGRWCACPLRRWSRFTV